MPRDVVTRWNSTFNMLKFALEYRQAIDVITADQDVELWAFELSEAEWKIAQQLHDILEVSSTCPTLFKFGAGCVCVF
jgi:hypothetical protein